MNLKNTQKDSTKNYQTGQLNHGGRATVRPAMAKPTSNLTVMPKARNDSQRRSILEDRGQL